MESINSTLEYAKTVINAKSPAGLENFIFLNCSHVSILRSLFAELKLRLDSAIQACDAVFALAKMDGELWCRGTDIDSCDIRKLAERCEYAITNPDALHDYTNFLLAQDSAADCGLGRVLSAFTDAGEDYRDLVGATEFVFFRSCAERVLQSDPQLRNHSGASNEHLRKQFQRLDREFLMLRRKLPTSTPPGKSSRASSPTFRPCSIIASAAASGLATNMGSCTRRYRRLRHWTPATNLDLEITSDIYLRFCL
jgi:hypothetical protein